jgi:hypothetical protein
MKQFNFLGFFMGKAFFCIFLGLMCFNRHKWFSWACSVLFFISGVFYICLSVTFWKEEKAKFRNISADGASSNNTSSNDVRDVNIQQKQNNV